MIQRCSKAVVAASVAAIAVSSCLLAGCQGRKMDNMVPTGDTVEVNPRVSADTIQQEVAATGDSIPADIHKFNPE